MDSSPPLRTESWGIKEVSEKTGITASTIRYYDQQFEDFLDLKRGAGRRRIFNAHAVDRLLKIHQLLKKEGLSLRQARKVLAGQHLTVTPTGEAVQDINWCRDQINILQNEVTALQNKVLELKDIQRRTLALVEGLARG